MITRGSLTNPAARVYRPERLAQAWPAPQFGLDKSASEKPPAPQTFKRWARIGLFSLAALIAPQASRPFVLTALYGDGSFSLANESSAITTRSDTLARRERLETYIRENFLEKGDGQISWSELADIADYVAAQTRTDEEFRRDLWYLFGLRNNGPRGLFNANLDKENHGLPDSLGNSDLSGGKLYDQEQMHHYLGGVTGSTSHGPLPTHLLNNPITALLNEVNEFRETGQFNWGDVRLFMVSMQHRDDFLRHGRSVVGKNIRSLLSENAKPVSG